MVKHSDVAFELLNEIKSMNDRAHELIEKYVDNACPEDLYLDFTTKEDPSKADLSNEDKRNLAKALSGFANSEGDLLIWGIYARREGNDPESPDVAREKRPINNLNAFHSALNGLLSRSTHPPVDGVQNLRIALPNDPDRGYTVTYVPASSTPPHRADCCNNNYYKRSGSSFYKLEPFDLRDLISRGNYPKIHLDFGWRRIKERSDSTRHLYLLKLTLRNAGPVLLDTWQLIIEMPAAVSGIGYPNFDWNSPTRHEYAGPDGEPWHRFTIRSHPIYQSFHNFFLIFPEDSFTLLGPGGPHQIYYQMNDAVYEHGGAKIGWRFYGYNTPLQNGEIQVVPGSFNEF